MDASAATIGMEYPRQKTDTAVESVWLFSLGIRYLLLIRCHLISTSV